MSINAGNRMLIDGGSTATGNGASEMAQKDIVSITGEYISFITETKRKPTYMELYNRLCANTR